MSLNVFIQKQVHPYEKESNLRKEAKDAFFSVHGDNGVKHPTEKKKKKRFNFRLPEEIKATIVTMLHSELRLVNGSACAV